MGFETLIYAIFRQTFEDYNELISCGMTYSTSSETARKTTKNSKYNIKPKYSIAEIQSFLRSGWCETLLCIIEKNQDPKMKQLINIALTGKDIIPLDVTVEYNGKSQTLTAWAEEYGMKYKTLYDRITSGWSFDTALTTPVRKVACVV